MGHQVVTSQFQKTITSIKTGEFVFYFNPQPIIVTAEGENIGGGFAFYENNTQVGGVNFICDNQGQNLGTLRLWRKRKYTGRDLMDLT